MYFYQINLYSFDYNQGLQLHMVNSQEVRGGGEGFVDERGRGLFAAVQFLNVGGETEIVKGGELNFELNCTHHLYQQVTGPVYLIAFT